MVDADGIVEEKDDSALLLLLLLLVKLLLARLGVERNEVSLDNEKFLDVFDEEVLLLTILRERNVAPPTVVPLFTLFVCDLCSSLDDEE